jgi:alkylation response protein AidB-like acyl-CoA dehydrogenase
VTSPPALATPGSSLDALLSPEQRAIRDVARVFADTEVAPVADANSRAARYPGPLIRRAAELGLLGLLIPVEFGGSGRGNLALTLVLEQVNRACASTGVTISVHSSLCSAAVERFAGAEARARYLPQLARGARIGAYCLTEPHSGSDAAALVTQARRDGEAYALSGTKVFVTTGAEASLYIVFARTDTSHKTRGITAFIVEREFPGVAVGKEEVKMGLSASHTVEIQLDGCRVPAANVLGQVGEGFKIALTLLDGGRIGIAAQALGIAQACLDASVQCVTTQIENGKPRSDQQMVQHALAEMATDIEAARHLTYHAARLRDAGAAAGTVTRAASMAKLFASQTCNRVARQAMQLHADAGTVKGAAIERYFRDARVTELYEGTTEVQKRVIARQMLQEYQDAKPEGEG